MKAFLFAIVIAIFFSSCYTFKQDMGKGAPKLVTVSKKRWYLIWGLSPLNTVDAKKMAGHSVDYTVKQHFNFFDVLIGLPTAFFLSTETVTVTREDLTAPKTYVQKEELPKPKSPLPPPSRLDSTMLRHSPKMRPPLNPKK